MKPEWYVPKELRTIQDLSFSMIRSMIWDALQERFDGASVCEDGIYISYIVFHKNNDSRRFYRIGYSIADGQVRLGESESQVEKTWVAARSTQEESNETAPAIRVTLDQAKDPEGLVWDVTIIRPGLSGHRPIPWLFEDEVLRASAALFEGVDVNLYDLPDKGATHVPDNIVDVKPYLVKKKAGWIDTVRHVADVGIQGVLHFLDSYKWLGQNLAKAVKDGIQPYGLSIDCPTAARMDEVDGKPVIRVTKFTGADSVDIVTRPAAGGKFNRAIAAHEEDMIMDKKALWELILRMRADLLEGKEFDKITEEELRAVADQMTPATPANPPAPASPDPEPAGGSQDPDPVALLRCEMALDKALSKAEFPERSEKRIRSLFENRVFEADELTRAIADEKDYLAAASKPQPDSDPVPGSGIIVGLGTLARAQMALDRTFGLTQEDMKEFAKMERLDNRPFFDDPVMRSTQDLEEFGDVPAFSGLRDMYTFFTGDPEVTGFFRKKRLSADLRTSMDITSATFSYVLGNTLGRRLVKSYRAVDYHEDLLISLRKAAKDFRTQEAVMVGYFPDIADVDPETADYDEIDSVTDEESTYSIGQKGNLLIITRKTVINDDVSLVQRLIDRFGRAFRRTHGKYVWAFFTSNATCSDGTAWFTSGHGNLGSNALSFAYALTAYKALAKMTEKDSGERIALLDGGDLKPNLVGPVDIMETIDSIANDEFYYSTNDLTTKTRNPLRNKVNAYSLAILTDTNDWGMLLPPSEVDMVEMGYLNGRQEPEFFVADTPNSEQVFVADKIRHKGRHEYAGAVVDFRSGYKAVVT
jgi:hypothetical protein